ncbi:MAG: (2Fe-2S)-binding protein, partial [Oscillospiraceae bacterium]|nr:(2Fe-2S)-binding protein [Oscillospiraceae bacterium]
CCEDVTKAEVLEAIRLGATTLDGVKRRTGIGMGRCQGSRCQQKLIALLAQALGVEEQEVTKDGAGSEILGGGRNEE